MRAIYRFLLFLTACSPPPCVSEIPMIAPPGAPTRPCGATTPRRSVGALRGGGKIAAPTERAGFGPFPNFQLSILNFQFAPQAQPPHHRLRAVPTPPRSCGALRGGGGGNLTSPSQRSYGAPGCGGPAGPGGSEPAARSANPPGFIHGCGFIRNGRTQCAPTVQIDFGGVIAIPPPAWYNRMWSVECGVWSEEFRLRAGAAFSFLTALPQKRDTPHSLEVFL